MEPIIDLIWSVEEDESIELQATKKINANCGGGGGGCCVACCCSIPSVLTKWLCPN